MNTFALILVIVLHMNDCLQMTADIKITGVANSLHHVLSKGLACLQSVDGHGTSFEVKGNNRQVRHDNDLATSHTHTRFLPVVNNKSPEVDRSVRSFVIVPLLHIQSF
jgi:hypothetical protein